MGNNNFKTPGQLIKSLLEERGWTQRLLSIILDVNETGLNNIVSGKRPVTAEMALMFGEVFNLPPEDFLNLQKEYDLAMARLVAQPDPSRATRARLFGDLPVSEMIKRGWIFAKDVRDVSKIESELLNFFGVDSINQIEILPCAAKKTDTTRPVTPAQLAWFYRVKTIAEEMIVTKYSKNSLLKAVGRLKKMLMSPEEIRKVPRILAESGIRFAVVESLSSAKIDGVCFWLDEASPVIGMSLRYDRIDNFWFVLRHEIEHVLRDHGRNAVIIDVELERKNSGQGNNIIEEERLANKAAADFCVPDNKVERFIARKYPFLKESDMLGLARTTQVHPGLVAGQIQRRTGRYNLFRKHLVKIRPFILPNAVIDGWGNIAPVGF